MGRPQTGRSETRRVKQQGGGNNGGDQRQPASNKKNKCFNCGKAGHKKADCRSLPSGGSRDSNNAPRNQGPRCKRCNRAGHAANECRTRPENLPRPRTDNNNAQTPRKCHTCQKPGHLARDCRSGARSPPNGQRNSDNTGPRPHRNSNNSGPRTDEKKCYNCGNVGHISRDCSNSKNVASATSKKQWPKSRRIDKDATILDRSKFHWSALELAAANELTRLLEINIDAGIQQIKIELQMMAKKPKIIERESWLRTTGERRKITYQPPIDHAELVERKKIFSEELDLSFQHFVVAQKDFFNAVYDSTRQAFWNVKQHQGDNDQVRRHIDNAQGRFEALDVKEKKMEYAVDWLNILLTEAQFRKTEGITEVRKNEAERLAKAAIRDAANLLNQRLDDVTVEDGTDNALSDEEKDRLEQEANRKRTRDERVNLAQRSINNTVFSE